LKWFIFKLALTWFSLVSFKTQRRGRENIFIRIVGQSRRASLKVIVLGDSGYVLALLFLLILFSFLLFSCCGNLLFIIEGIFYPIVIIFYLFVYSLMISGWERLL
jgi:hypothetical protein